MAVKTVLVTGASSGIGRALAIELATRGAHVALCARREEELQITARAIEARNGRALVLPVDVADPGAIAEAVKKADRDLGALEMVIANAGVGHYGHAGTLAWPDVERVFDVNVRGAIATLLAAVPIFLAHQRGHLVGVTSLAGRRGLPSSGPYSASKAAVSTFLETLRIDLKEAGIRVTDVQPGFVATEMTKGLAHARPFEWTADKAARVICNRLASAPPIIAFPWPLALLTHLSRYMPAWMFDRLSRAAS
jgi:short-subunit dehydrogenase